MTAILESAELNALFVKSLDEIEQRFTPIAGPSVRVAIFVYDDHGGRMASTEEPRLAAVEVRNMLDAYGENFMLPVTRA